MSQPTSTRPPTSHIAPFGLRMQPDLRAKLEAAAGDAGRSLNAEITARLHQSFQTSESVDLKEALKAAKVGDLISELLSRYGPGDIYVRIGSGVANEDKDED